MCVAAHPDDEDDATLALYRMKYGVRTIAVIATRGEGGQNEIGPELYNDLGVIRTREMMRA
ncbi:MAG: PIG-L family deacetylase, partial [Candidatus Hydrogenedentes bacterium]|nr:PIG-L family deacetylase [Candidatus Hydrogenedentota bacterium]